MSFLLGNMREVPFAESYPIVTDRWLAIAGLTVLFRRHRSILMRVSSIGILILCYFHTRSAHYVFNEILNQMMLPNDKTRQQSATMGSHYSLKVAHIIFSELLIRLGLFLFPDRVWTLTIIVTLMTLLYPRIGLWELWMQRQLTRLAQWNRLSWKWRGLLIESSVLYLGEKCDCEAKRVLMPWLFDVLHKSPTFVTHLMDSFSTYILYMTCIGRYKQVPSSYKQWFNTITAYRFCLDYIATFSKANPPPHKYKPLRNPDDIRLLILYPRFAFQPIKCSLVQGPHLKLTNFEAISYTWGNTSGTEEILVDGCKRNITKNLYEILASYSSIITPRLLWIDALCIDQENETEKSLQVQLMGRIYLQATLVTVWLNSIPNAGDTQSSTRTGMQYRYDEITAIDEETKSHFEDARLAFGILTELKDLDEVFEKRDLNVYSMYETLQFGSTSKSRQWNALLRLLRHPWFERVWVVQEVSIPQCVRVRWGEEVIDWDTLASGMAKLQNLQQFRVWLEWSHGIQLRNLQHTTLYNVTRMNSFREKIHGKYSSRYPSLAELLAESFYFKASNPKDLIFGFMGICHRKDVLQVDYSASVEDIYFEAAKALFKKKQFSLLIHAAGAGNHLNPSTLSLPSWVPDWTRAPKYGRLSNFSAGGTVTPQVHIEGDVALLTSGFRVDDVAEFGPILFDAQQEPGKWSLNEVIHLAQNYTSFFKQLDDSLFTTSTYPIQIRNKKFQSIQEAARDTLTSNIPSEYYHGGSPTITDAWEWNLQSFQSDESVNQPTLTRDVIYARLKAMDTITERVRRSCADRRLFITSKGYIGLCPPYTKVGDSIHVIPGINTPVILRNQKQSSLSETRDPGRVPFVLVGECYLHGVMFGEAKGMNLSGENIAIL